MYNETEIAQMHNQGKEASWRQNFEELKVKYEDLQDLFVQTDEELDIYRGKFVDEALQNGYLKNEHGYLRDDIQEIKSRLHTLELLVEKIDAFLIDKQV
jgi:predicted  nucleic acid-binding Zn-ribbon protein